MKTNFQLFQLLIFAFLLVSSCYSVEFFPEHDYPNLKLKKIKNVEIKYRRPIKSYQKLGILIVRDFTGDIADRNFLRMISSEAKKRGAQGAWIISRIIRHQTRFQAETMDRRRRHRMQTGNVKGRIGIVKIILYNYNYQYTK